MCSNEHSTIIENEIEPSIFGGDLDLTAIVRDRLGHYNLVTGKVMQLNPMRSQVRLAA